VRLNRFFCPAIATRDGVLTVPDREIASQITRVLRLAANAPVEIFDGSGRVVFATYLDATREAARFQIVREETRDDAARVARRVDLHPAAIKGDHLSLVVEKGTELGVASVTPVVAARSVKRDANPTRLARIARESAEQCGRVTVPETGAPLALADALGAAATSGAKIVVLDQDATETFGAALAGASHVAIFTGPEGGWDELDRKLFEATGASMAALGGFVLRAETAAIVAAALATRE
jgi:16S rRNA (uracil1498-N3)-methyltransferase